MKPQQRWCCANCATLRDPLLPPVSAVHSKSKGRTVSTGPHSPPNAALDDKKAPDMWILMPSGADHERWLISASAESVAHRAAASGVGGLSQPQISVSAQRRAAQRKAAAEALEAKKNAPMQPTAPAAGTSSAGSSTSSRTQQQPQQQPAQQQHDEEAEDENDEIKVVTPQLSPRGSGGVPPLTTIQYPRQPPVRPPTPLPIVLTSVNVDGLDCD